MQEQFEHSCPVAEGARRRSQQVRAARCGRFEDRLLVLGSWEAESWLFEFVLI